MGKFLLFSVSLAIFIHLAKVELLEPSFDVPLVNITANAGETAILPCSVQHLGKHMVAWVDPREKVLTARDQRVIADPRISVERSYTDEWNLYIRDVEHTDAGKYMCQINTSPVKIKYILLLVHEPPKIIDESSTPSVRSREGSMVQLVCNATGIPLPTVTWYRRRSDMNHPAKEVVGENGEVLLIHNISRYCEDLYECVAVNGIPPAASREIKVIVEFAPEIHLVPKRISQSIGKETILDCRITANPHIYSAWVRHGQEIENSYKYQVELYTEESKNTVTLSLRIKMIEQEDFGEYICRASNKLGKDDESVFLTELVVKTDPPKTTADAYIRPTTKKIDYDFEWGIDKDQYKKNLFNGYVKNPSSLGKDQIQERKSSRNSSPLYRPYIHAVLAVCSLSWLCLFLKIV